MVELDDYISNQFFETLADWEHQLKSVEASSSETKELEVKGGDE